MQINVYKLYILKFTLTDISCLPTKANIAENRNASCLNDKQIL